MTDTAVDLTRREIVRVRAQQISFNLDPLLLAASELWTGETITSASVARVLGVRPNHLTDMALGRAQQVTFDQLGLITWYFGASVDQFLTYRSLLDDDPQPRLVHAAARAPLPLARYAAPAGPPGPGAIVVVNRLPVLISSMQHSAMAELTGRKKSNISRYAHTPITRIGRATLAEVLETYKLPNLSAILSVRHDLTNYSATGKPAPDAVRIETVMPVWKSVDWESLVQEWRNLIDIWEPAGSDLSDIDVVTVRYIYTLIAANQGGQVPRLGGQLASALKVSRETVSTIVTSNFRPYIEAINIPRNIRMLIHQTLQLPPL